MAMTPREDLLSQKLLAALTVAAGRRKADLPLYKSLIDEIVEIVTERYAEGPGFGRIAVANLASAATSVIVPLLDYGNADIDLLLQAMGRTILRGTTDELFGGDE